ncbi:hypothetical protein AGMMS50267_14210 [Spirochaetia bacterium]|nr:hypothetical protein AGMMS50267_14210 [Spirochaetia bacterium]
MISNDDLLQCLLSTKENCLIHGMGGSGKSYLINKLSDHGQCLKLAPTGFTATNIQGTTIDNLLTLYKYHKKKYVGLFK